MLNIGLIGYNERVRDIIIPALARSNHIALSHFCHQGDGQAEGLPAGVRIYANLDNMFIDETIDIFLICSPHNHRMDHCAKALKAGKPVMVDSAITSNNDKAVELVTLAEEQDVLLVELCSFLFHKQYKALKNTLDHIGPEGITKIDANISFPITLGYGGGALLDVGFYPIAMMEDMFNIPDKITRDVYGNEDSHSDETMMDEGGSASLTYGPTVCNLSWRYDINKTDQVLISHIDGEIGVMKAFIKDQFTTTHIASSFTMLDGQDIEAFDEWPQMIEHFASRLNSEPSKKNQRRHILARTHIRQQIIAEFKEDALRRQRVIKGDRKSSPSKETYV